MSILSDATGPTAAVEGGFTDPVFDAQAVFSSVLEAFARPGHVVDLGGRCVPPPPLGPAQGAFLAAMADHETPVFVDSAEPVVAEWLAFQTGASSLDAGSAVFAVLPTFDSGALERLPLGTLRNPDLSATVLVEVADFASGEEVVLKGPGIDGSRSVRIAGLADGFFEARTRNRALAPCGLDLVLTCGSQLMALPRSTQVERS